MIDHNNQEEYRDPRNYDLEFGGETDKYEFFLELAKQHPGHVLELACGTGLVALFLAERGIPITGVDIVEPMLAYARGSKRRVYRLNLSKQMHVHLKPISAFP